MPKQKAESRQPSPDEEILALKDKIDAAKKRGNHIGLLRSVKALTSYLEHDSAHEAYIFTLRWLIEKDPAQVEKVLQETAPDSKKAKALEPSHKAWLSLSFDFYRQGADSFKIAAQIASIAHCQTDISEKNREIAGRLMLIIANDYLKEGVPGIRAADDIIHFVLKHADNEHVLRRAITLGIESVAERYRYNRQAQFASRLESTIKDRVEGTPALKKAFETACANVAELRKILEPMKKPKAPNIFSNGPQ